LACKYKTSCSNPHIKHFKGFTHKRYLQNMAGL